jgi:hypothetical protein
LLIFKKQAMENENKHPTQSETSEQADFLGGTTNLSLEQLKKEGGIANFTEDNADGLTDQDDLNEIRAADDLDEPDVEEFQPEEDEETDDGGDDKSANDVDGNGGAADEPANPAELNS